VLLLCGLGASVDVAFLLLEPYAAVRPRRALTGEEEEVLILAEVPLLGGPPEEEGDEEAALGEGEARLPCSRLLLVEGHQRCHGRLGFNAKNISALP
jgi:hypothetical protein